jgi:asparagine synthase (glutamine-hydrolysing)
MCGISVYFHKEKVTSELYKEFCDSLQLINHRGPDDEGIVLINTSTGDYNVSRSLVDQIEVENGNWVENYNLILGHKRLSILELSAKGHQPMKGCDGSWIMFNGEIYNYIELREELKSIGCNFNGNSDTEVILEAYRMWGKNCLNKFNGMWSIIIWDNRNKDIFISNDRFGVKPLYYFETPNGFKLISETKQITAYREVNTGLNQSHIRQFLEYGYADTDENTMYNGLYRFKKSNYISFSSNKYQIGWLRENQINYYKINGSRVHISKEQAIEKFKFLFQDAVKIRMRADVDFAFAISGGLDSSAILYTAKKLLSAERKDDKIKAFASVSPGFESADESKFIKIVTDDLKCDTTYCNAMEDFSITDFESHVYHQDEPLNGTSFMAQWNIYKNVSKTGIKILFNGQGADEVFAGYHHHFYKYCRQLIAGGKLIKYLKSVKAYSSIKGISSNKIHQLVLNEIRLKLKFKNTLSETDSKLFNYWNQIDNLHEILVRDFDTFQLPTYLRVDDRNSMAFSIESRHPFMDYRLVDFGFSLPENLLINNGWQKYLIRESMAELPPAIRYRTDKKGFTTPHEEWMKKYHDDFADYLSYFDSNIGGFKSADTYRKYSMGAWFKKNLSLDLI